MYLSTLLIDVGSNPDRPRPGRLWLRNAYRVHQRLCMAFPSKAPASQEKRIAAYCAPFTGTDMDYLHDLPGEPDMAPVHHVRSDDAGFLFRIDYPVCDVVDGNAKWSGRGIRRPVIIVQSANKPDWELAFGLTENRLDDRERPIGNAGFLLCAPPQVKKVSIDIHGDTLALSSPRQSCRLSSGELLRFRLRANPTRKVQDGSRNGKRKRINPEFQDHAKWLASKLGDAAGSPISIETFVPGWAYGWRTKHEPQPNQRMQWWSVLFEGRFRLGDVTALKGLLEGGIGPAKAFGFGLLSLAPASAPDGE